ncbi:MAG: hypothetical protein WCY29_14895 [Novosphingobium sp.]
MAERPGRNGGILASPAAQAAIFVLVALALKATTFGDTNRSVDEMFYFLVAQRMHEGLVPYVDVWDRKPLGLFLIYYLIAGVSRSVVSYQIVACLFAAATALAICRLVAGWVGTRGGLFAGLAYLLVACTFVGVTGQAPDLYNPLIVSAALLIVRDMDALARGRVGWRVWTAMALCGLAITIKQTTAFEAAFFGLYVLYSLHRAGVPAGRMAAVAGLCMLIGAAPMLLIAGWYWQAGHWPEFWHAMVTSNFAKAAPGRKLFRLTAILLYLALLLPFAAWGLSRTVADRRARPFLLGWLAAALVGFLSVPNFFVHYTLPLLVPLCVAAGLLFGTHRRSLPLFVAFALYANFWYNPLQSEWTRASRASMAHAARLIRQHDSGGGLLLFDAPSYLYALTGERFLSPLAFPHHLSDALENDVSHLDTHAEIDRILAGRPGVIVMARHPLITPINLYSRARVMAYARANCRIVDIVRIYDAAGKIPFVIFGDCARK